MNMEASILLTVFFMLILASGDVVEISEFEDSMTRTEDFSWENCNKIPVPIKIEELSMEPPIMQLGRFFKINTTISIDRRIGENGTPIEVEFSLKMKIDGEYSDLCYLVPAGYCYLPNFCTNLEKWKSSCPKHLKKELHNCTCPLEKSTYALENYVAMVPKQPFMISGSFEMILVFRENGKDVGCVLIRFKVEY